MEKLKQIDKQKGLFLANLLPALIIVIGGIFGQGVKVAGICMLAIIAVSIVGIIFGEEFHHKNAWTLIISVIIAELLATVIHYFVYSNDFETPIVGGLFCALYGGLGLIFLLIGTGVNMYREYRRKENEGF